MKTTKEKKSIRKALRSIYRFINDFGFENQERYEQLFGFLNSDCNLPDFEHKLILSYVEEFLNPDSDIFQSLSYADVAEYSCTDLRGNDLYTVVPGKEQEFLSRLENTLVDIYANFDVLERRVCA